MFANDLRFAEKIFSIKIPFSLLLPIILYSFLEPLKCQDLDNAVFGKRLLRHIRYFYCYVVERWPGDLCFYVGFVKVWDIRP